MTVQPGWSDGKVVLKCHAGCRTEDVLATLGLGWADLHPSGRNGKAEIVATYDYTDEQGGLLYQSVRYFPKDFRRRRSRSNASSVVPVCSSLWTISTVSGATA